MIYSTELILIFTVVHSEENSPSLDLLLLEMNKEMKEYTEYNIVTEQSFTLFIFRYCGEQLVQSIIERIIVVLSSRRD